MSNRGNSKQVQIRTSTSKGPNKMTIVRETTYTTKTKETITFQQPKSGRAVKGGNKNYVTVKESYTDDDYNYYGGYYGGYSGGGNRW